MSQKTITVDGDETSWYEKVIFVVPNDFDQIKMNEEDLLSQAENIVNNFFIRECIENSKDNSKTKEKKPAQNKKKTSKIDAYLYCSLAFCFCVLMYMAFDMIVV